MKYLSVQCQVRLWSQTTNSISLFLEKVATFAGKGLGIINIMVKWAILEGWYWIPQKHCDQDTVVPWCRQEGTETKEMGTVQKQTPAHMDKCFSSVGGKAAQCIRGIFFQKTRHNKYCVDTPCPQHKKQTKQDIDVFVLVFSNLKLHFKIYVGKNI